MLFRSGYRQADVIKVAGNDGGAQALAALGTHGPALLDAGYQQADVIKVAGNGGGAQALAALNKWSVLLVASGFSIKQLASMAAVPGSAKKLDLVAAHGAALKKRGVPPGIVTQHVSRRQPLGALQAWLLARLT